MPRGTFIVDDGSAILLPDFAGLAVRQVARACQELGLEPIVRGSGLAIEQNPPAGTQARVGMRIWIRFARQ